MSEALSEQARSDAANTRLPDGVILERTISTIEGVSGVRIVMGPEEEIKELHVLASPCRAPKKIIRDIESLLLVRHGYRIDYRRISIVQVAESRGSTAARVELRRVDCSRAPQGVFIEVELRDGRGTYRGRHPLADDAAHAAAMATVAAINGLCTPSAPIKLCGVQCSTIGQRQVVTAYVMYNGTEHLLGTAFVRSTVSAAAVRAVLAATNRLLIDGLQGNVPCGVAQLITT